MLYLVFYITKCKTLNIK